MIPTAVVGYDGLSLIGCCSIRLVIGEGPSLNSRGGGPSA